MRCKGDKCEGDRWEGAKVEGVKVRKRKVPEPPPHPARSIWESTPTLGVHAVRGVYWCAGRS